MSVEVSPELERPDREKLIGTVLANRYQIESLLGEGAMGAVYKARHVKVGRPFAVKVLHPHLLEDPKLALRFEREAELAGRLRHPNVIGVVDVGETPDGWRYMVMDFAAGVDLATLLSEAPMKPERIIHLVRQMLEGLYHAHEAGLIHRDFKPENVIVELDDHDTEVPRIVDFGIAILREGGDSTNAAGRLTTNGLVLGTPHYMAPEQAVADPIDHRIDLFAMGIVIYEMLSGRLPFDGSGAEVARANLLLDPPPIAQRVPHLEVDPLLEAFARKLMAKRRDQRPATAKAARELLDLIERDRRAAGAALGVSATSIARVPAVTEDVAPSPRIEIQDVPVLPEPVEAPPMTVPHAPSTAAAEPLAWEPPRRAPWKWLALGGAGVIAAGVAIAIAMSGSSYDAPPPPQLAATPTETAPAPLPPAPVEQAPEPAPAPAPVAEQPQPAPPPAEVPKQEKKRPKPTPRVVTKKESPPAPTPPPAVTVAPSQPPPPTATPSENDVVIALYKQVRGELNAAKAALGVDAVADIDSQVHSMQIYELIATPKTAAAAKAKLTELHQKLSALLKK